MNTPQTFQVDVSRVYRNKEGYEVGGYKLNTSFQTEPHTPETFLDSVVKEGWPYTMVFNHERWPAETGAAARGVKTPKHIENFISRQELTADDDSKAPGVIDFWLHDSFFSAYGYAFVESVRSIPGQAEKGHPTIIFDHPIICPKLYKESAKALAWKYPRLDQGIHNIDRTIYNAVGARVHLLGNICPFDVFEREILTPYRAHLADQARIEAEYQQRRKAELEKAKAEGRVKKDAKTIEDYLARSLDGIFRFVASQAHTRHKVIYWAGQKIGEYKAAEWTEPFERLFDDVDIRIVEAARLNGYLATYAHDNEAEVLRTFNAGRSYGSGSKAPEPELYERKAPEAKAAEPTPEDIADLERIGAEARAGLEGHDARSRELGELRSRLQASLDTLRDERNGADKPKYGYVMDGLEDIFLRDDYAGVDDHYYKTVVVPARKGYSKPSEWADQVRLYFPDLDPEREYKLKREENRHRRAGFCGMPLYYQNADGSIRTEHALCGVCEKCKTLQKENLKRAIGEVTQDDPDHCLTLIVAQSKKEKARLVRKLKLYKCFPVRAKAGTVYHVLYPGTPQKEHREQAYILDIVDVKNDLLTAWINTPDGSRSSGKLFGNFRSIQSLYGLKDEFEGPPGPDAREIELPGIVLNDRIEPPYAAIEGEVTNFDELQAAIWDIHKLTAKELWGRRGEKVILCIVTRKKYYALNHEKTLCDLFNAANAKRQAKIEARRRKK